jgi:hypothetical protein
MRLLRPRFSLRTLLVMVSLCAIGIYAPYWIPKSQALFYGDAYVGYYRGLGYTNERGYFGKNWYRIVVHEDADGYWEVDVNGMGYNSYRGYYGTGVLREEGMCLVEENADDIAPDRHDLLHGKFYDPKGNLIAEVKNRTGKQILCFADGTRFWELDLVNGQRARVRMWYPNGQLVVEEKFVEGRWHGKTVGYHPNGQIRFCGEYAAGKRVGIWRRYKEDGSLESETNHDLVSK